MQNLDAMDTDKIETWLDRVELFLMELKATDRATIILDLNQQIQAQFIVSHDLKVDDVLKKMGDPMQVANRIRNERGFKPRKRQSKKSSVGSTLLFLFISCFVVLATCTAGVRYAIPWGFNKMANEMGTQGDGTSRSFHFFKSFGGSRGGKSTPEEQGDPNDLNAENPSAEPEEEAESGESESQSESVQETANGPEEAITGTFESSGLSAIHLQAKAVKLTVTSGAKASEIQYDCKIATLNFARSFIRKSPSGVVTFAIDQLGPNASCDIKVPPELSVEIQIETGEVEFKNMSQNVSLDAKEAEVSFAAAPDSIYQLETNTKKGAVKGLTEFGKKQLGVKSDKKYSLHVNLESGNISLQ